MSDCKAPHTFRNWSRTIEFSPRRFCEPRTEQRVIEIVEQALHDGTHVRTQGAGHSFSQLLPTRDTLLSLEKLKETTVVDGDRVTVSGGMRLEDVIKELKRHGLALKNLGSITEQSIAGAISTGTHGTGIRLGSLSSQVVGAKLVTGTGRVVTFTEAHGHYLEAARISVGALGILTALTLDCRPMYQVDYDAYLCRLDDVLADIDTLNRENDRVLLWWLVTPRVLMDYVVLVTKNDGGRARSGFLADAIDRVPPLEAGVRRLPLPMDPDEILPLVLPEVRAEERRCIWIWHASGDYDEMLTLPLLPVYHRECEWAIPVEYTSAAVKALRPIIRESDFSLPLPLEVRFVAADRTLLSPANRGDVCYVGLSTFADNAPEVYERFEPLMRSFGGRPHWGKLFTLTRSEVAAMYAGTYDTFNRIRKELDPEGVFKNTFLEELFGP